jgi:hypothetical protein
MVDLAGALLVHVGIIDVCENISLFDETTTRRRPARNQTFHSQTSMITGMKNNSNATSYGLVHCFGSGSISMGMGIHLTWMQSVWRRGAGSRVILKHVRLTTVSLSAFNIHHIISCVLKMMLQVRIGHFSLRVRWGDRMLWLLMLTVVLMK